MLKSAPGACEVIYIFCGQDSVYAIGEGGAGLRKIISMAWINSRVNGRYLLRNRQREHHKCRDRTFWFEMTFQAFNLRFQFSFHWHTTLLRLPFVFLLFVQILHFNYQAISLLGLLRSLLSAVLKFLISAP